MPPPYTILNARVKQKIATEADWLLVEAALGPILAGEAAYVYNNSGVAVNFKIGDGTKLFSQLPYFIAYMSGITNQKVLSYVNQNANITIPITFRNNSFLQQIIFLNNSGAPVTLKVGITNGGAEVLQTTLPTGASTIDASFFFENPETVYLTGLTGATFSVFLIYNQIDEQPVAPTSPGGGQGITSAFVFGVPYPFLPAYAGHEDYAWDFITGKGKIDTEFEGCTLYGYGGLPAIEHKYLRAYKVGDTLGGGVGSPGITLAMENLPADGIGLFTTPVNTNEGETPGVNDPVARARAHSSQALDYEMSKGSGMSYVGKSAKLGLGTAIENIPESITVLYFTGPQLTT